jgi:DNA repair exonuclease SbcCD ATPase subunit
MVDIENGLKLVDQAARLDASIGREVSEGLSIKAKIEAIENTEIILENIEDSQAYIDKWPSMSEIWNEYQTFKNMGLTEPYWEGDETNFLAELHSAQVRKEIAVNEIAEIKSNIKVEQSKISKTTVCPTCNTDISDRVVKINRAAMKNIEEWSKTLANKEQELTIYSGEVRVFEQIKSKHRKQQFKYITFDTDTVPFTAKWEHEVPAEPCKTSYNLHLQSVQRFKDNLKQIEVNTTRLAELWEMLAKSEERLGELKKDREALGEVDPTLEEKKAQLSLVIKESEAGVKDLEESVKAVEKRIIQIKTEIEEKETSIAVCENDIKVLNEKIMVDRENTRFLKVLRDTKPKVLQKVWSSILAVIETPFKEITGKDFTIDRGSKGFTAGGRPAARLSGSERSVLGLCFRAALRDLFAPGCGFILLDEIFADCDGERTAAGIAALMQMGRQRVLITHEGTSEMTADQVIEL